MGLLLCSRRAGGECSPQIDSCCGRSPSAFLGSASVNIMDMVRCRHMSPSTVLRAHGLRSEASACVVECSRTKTIVVEGACGKLERLRLFNGGVVFGVSLGQLLHVLRRQCNAKDTAHDSLQFTCGTWAMQVHALLLLTFADI